jgi:3-oxoacyl-[acyl-carrier protein] reductase
MQETKIVLITGAAQGLGKAITEAFAKRNFIPIITDIDSDKGRKTADEISKRYKKEIPFFELDVSSPDEISVTVNNIVNKYKTIHVLVNNAGILHTTAIPDVTEEEWDRILSVNLKSVFFMSQQILPYMQNQKWGRIINLSSSSGRTGGIGSGLAYDASKGGILGLTRGMARKVAEFNITVNAVAPGTTSTDVIKKIPEEKQEMLKSIIPLHRFGRPEEIGETVCFLASEGAGFITGATIDINGGLFIG